MVGCRWQKKLEKPLEASEASDSFLLGPMIFKIPRIRLYELSRSFRSICANFSVRTRQYLSIGRDRQLCMKDAGFGFCMQLRCSKVRSHIFLTSGFHQTTIGFISPLPKFPPKSIMSKSKGKVVEGVFGESSLQLLVLFAHGIASYKQTTVHLLCSSHPQSSAPLQSLLPFRPLACCGTLKARD